MVLVFVARRFGWPFFPFSTIKLANKNNIYRDFVSASVHKWTHTEIKATSTEFLLNRFATKIGETEK